MEAFPFLDPALPIETRVKDLVSRLTLGEKISQMMHNAAAIPRLGIPEYDWWNECLHGVARAGIATVFPQAIGLAATWDTDLMHKIAVAISDEARAKHHEAARRGVRRRYTGLTFWSPNINIFRDPRWGRGQETFGEDPHLTARLGVAFVKGLQGEHERYLKVIATPKHFAAHSGPENLRHEFDAQVSRRTMQETYLPAFKACVQEGRAASVMGAYNRVNGEPCCASPTLMKQILRKEWGFEGYVVSDCNAIRDIYLHHRVARSLVEAAAMAVEAGCDLNCGESYAELQTALDQGFISEETINRSVERLFGARFRLGMFDPPELVPYAHIPYEVVDCPTHRELALRAARESIVLLKNDGILPLPDDGTAIQRIAVIGPNADDVLVLLGNYHGTPSRAVTILEGLQERAFPKMAVAHAKGCEILDPSREGFDEAVELARSSDLAILVLGLSQLMEGEEGQMEGIASGARSLGDRESLDLPSVQEELLKTVAGTGTPVVLVLLNGSPVAVNWAEQYAAAILEVWYPGQAGGTSVAEVLFGDYNPAGRLPVTFYKSVEQLPPFTDYSVAGRTYRYFKGEPLYPFGYGLSYTSFSYQNPRIDPMQAKLGEEIQFQIEVKNEGHRTGEEVVQLYLKRESELLEPAPGWQLRGFERIQLCPGEARTVVFKLHPEQLAYVDEGGAWVLAPGEFRMTAGGRSPGPETKGVMIWAI